MICWQISFGKPATGVSTETADSMLNLFGSADQLDKLPPSTTVIINEVAKENGLSNQEALVFMRIGLKALQNEKEGKADTDGFTKVIIFCFTFWFYRLIIS